MNNNEELFVSILSKTATAEKAKQSLREAIFWQIVNTSAVNMRITESTFGCMRIAAENIAASTSVDFYCDNKVVDHLSFDEGDSQHQLRTLWKLYNLVVQYNSWYGDADGDGNDNRGFCWEYNNHHYRLIFRR